MLWMSIWCIDALVANLSILKHLLAFVTNWPMSRLTRFLRKIHAPETAVGKWFDKYHVWQGVIKIIINLVIKIIIQKFVKMWQGKREKYYEVKVTPLLTARSKNFYIWNTLAKTCSWKLCPFDKTLPFTGLPQAGRYLTKERWHSAHCAVCTVASPWSKNSPVVATKLPSKFHPFSGQNLYCYREMITY